MKLNPDTEYFRRSELLGSVYSNDSIWMFGWNDRKFEKIFLFLFFPFYFHLFYFTFIKIRI